MLSSQPTRKARFRPRELLVLLLLLVLLVIVLREKHILFPKWIDVRITQRMGCRANLQSIDRAKEQWALENKLTAGTPPDVKAINSYLKNSLAPDCPANGTYSYNPVETPPTCSLGATLGHTL